MPELPEVESLRLDLLKSVKGKKIKKVKVITGKIVSGSGNIRIDSKSRKDEFTNAFTDKVIVDIKRRAKNLIIELDDRSIILVHLKMTGQLMYNKDDSVIIKHTHIIFDLDDGYMIYNDVRKFGYVLYYKDMENAIQAGHFKKIGLEPFDKKFTPEYLREQLQIKNTNLKSILLNQEIVVGCGNIYADEICYASNVSPLRNTRTITISESERLYDSIIHILKLAIKNRGSSISDYRLVDGSKGSYASLHKVYGRAGLKCLRCDNTLEKSIISNRTTVYCMTCQL